MAILPSAAFAESLLVEAEGFDTLIGRPRQANTSQSGF
jgi:hypothetical protein